MLQSKLQIYIILYNRNTSFYIIHCRIEAMTAQLYHYTATATSDNLAYDIASRGTMFSLWVQTINIRKEQATMASKFRKLKFIQFSLPSLISVFHEIITQTEIVMSQGTYQDQLLLINKHIIHSCMDLPA